MTSKYGIWLSWNNQEEGFELPVLPSEIGPSIRGDGAGNDVYKLGKINVIKDREVAEYTIESLFPAQPYPFITASIVLEPRAYIDYIMKWWETKRPIRFVYVGATMEINTPASIEQFDWKEVAGSPGDISFSLRLKEYRFYAAKKVTVAKQTQPTGGQSQVIQKIQPPRPNDRQPPQTYTLAPGDNLVKVAKKLLGDDSKWREIQKLNGISDAELKRLPVGKVLRIPVPSGGVGIA